MSMPGRNIYKIDLPETFYHVYTRGINKQIIFRDTEDFSVFFNLLKRYLGKKLQKDDQGRVYPNFYDELEILAFCLMQNHIHLLVYQQSTKAMQSCLRSLLTSFSVYHNKKYQRRGPVFESRYRASLIDRDDYLLHISRYIHLNPKKWKNYQYSSLPYYMNHKRASWVRPEKILDLFEQSESEYIKFVADYEEQKKYQDELKTVLAHI